MLEVKAREVPQRGDLKRLYRNVIFGSVNGVCSAVVSNYRTIPECESMLLIIHGTEKIPLYKVQMDMARGKGADLYRKTFSKKVFIRNSKILGICDKVRNVYELV